MRAVVVSAGKPEGDCPLLDGDRPPRPMAETCSPTIVSSTAAWAVRGDFTGDKTLTETNPLVVIHNSFYAVAGPFSIGDFGDEASLNHVPLGDQQPQAPRRIAMPVLNALVESGDAVFVDPRLLDAATRRVARRRAKLAATGDEASPREAAAFERFLLLLKSGKIRSAASMIGKVDVPAPA